MRSLGTDPEMARTRDGWPNVRMPGKDGAASRHAARSSGHLQGRPPLCPGVKEDVILRDDFDDRLFEAFDRQPRSLTPVAALRAALRETV